MVNQKERDTPVLDQYLTDFRLKEEDLRGRILDLGAGMRMLAKEALELGLARIYSISESRLAWMETQRMVGLAKRVNPDAEVIKLWGEVDSLSLEGEMQALPFATGSFDLILSRDALTHVFDNELPVKAALFEVMRVLAPGGEARIFPGWLDNWTEEERGRVIWALSEIESYEGVVVEIVKIERLWAGMLKVPGVMIVLHKS